MTIYYVAKTGSDSANGSSSTPWKTISKAMSASLKPGDEVVVRAGTYTEQVNISADGTASNYITLRSEVPGAAQIRPPSGTYSTVTIRGDYVVVDGFDIVGGGGHAIDGEKVHHSIVRNNITHDSGGSGISFYLSEFQTIENNVVYGNAGTNGYQTSGISVASNINVSGDTTTTGFRTIIRNNISHDNMETSVAGEHTDGNGIIIDWFRNDGTGYAAYNYPTLVENNLVYQNGGKGIQVFMSDNVTVRNNTAYHNNLDLKNTGTERGEITITSTAANATVVNNIAVADPSVNKSNTAFSLAHSSAVVENNLSFNGTAGQSSVALWNGATFDAADGNQRGVNPNFVDAANEDFHLKSTSSAVNAGTGSFGLPAADLDGGDRTIGVVDLGAYEYGSDGTSGGGGTTPTPDVNVDPVAKDDAGLSTTAGKALTISSSSLLANDTDADGDSLSVSSVGSATNGSVSLKSDGSVVFTPKAGFTGTAGFDYSITDGQGGSDSAHVTIDIQAAVVTPPTTPTQTFSLWSSTVKPAVVSDSDGARVEVGLKFTADVASEVDALRFYKGSQNTGIQSVSIWSADGKLVAKQAVSGLTSSGWQEVAFDTPVKLEAGKSYIASYYTTSGHYSVSENYFTAGYDAGPVTIAKNAGVYSYGSASVAPTKVYAGSNYWIDLVLDTGTKTTAATESTVSATDLIGETGVVTVSQASATAWHTVTFSDALDNPAVVMSVISDNAVDGETIRVRNVTSTGFEFQIDEWDSLDGKHTSEKISWMAVESGTHTLADGRTIVAGTSTAAGAAKAVAFGETFANAPVVFAQVSDDTNAFAVNDRIMKVGTGSFSVLLEQQEAGTATIASEKLGWIAIEKGGSTDQMLVGATGNTVTDKAAAIDFGGSFGSDSFAFLTDMQTRDGTDSATVEVVSLTADGASVRIAEETSKDAETAHASEDVGYAAIEAGQLYAQHDAGLLVA